MVNHFINFIRTEIVKKSSRNNQREIIFCFQEFSIKFVSIFVCESVILKGWYITYLFKRLINQQSTVLFMVLIILTGYALNKYLNS